MTISSQIIEVLDHICTKFGIAIDWSQQNIMPYLQELASKYISYEVATSIAWLIGFVLLAILGIVICVIDIKMNSTYCGMGIVIGVFCIFIAISGIIVQVEDILCCKFFPEKQIVEYVKSLMQNQ